jgi:hypothetical protein
MVQYFIRPILVFAFTMAAAGCDADTANNAAGSGERMASSSGETAAAADPCSFISKEDVSAVTGEAVIKTQAAGETCTYETDDDASAVRVEIKQAGGAEEMEVARSAAGVLGDMGSDMKGSGGAKGDVGELLTDAAAAPKIGDQAFFGPNQQLHVLKGDSYFAVSPPMMRSRMTGGNPLMPAAQKRKIAAEIAQKVAAKL